MDTSYNEHMDLAQPHSRFGIVSTIIGVSSILILCGGFAAVMLIATSMGDQQGSPAQEQDLMISLIGSMCGAPLSLVGLALAVGGFFELERQRPFVIFGMILNGVVLLTYLCGLVALISLGTG